MDIANKLLNIAKANCQFVGFPFCKLPGNDETSQLKNYAQQTLNVVSLVPVPNSLRLRLCEEVSDNLESIDSSYYSEQMFKFKPHSSIDSMHCEDAILLLENFIKLLPTLNKYNINDISNLPVKPCSVETKKLKCFTLNKKYFYRSTRSASSSATSKQQAETKPSTSTDASTSTGGGRGKLSGYAMRFIRHSLIHKFSDDDIMAHLSISHLQLKYAKIRIIAKYGKIN